MESVVRITSAGFGGSLAGLALERQSAVTSQTRRPVIAAKTTGASLPSTWAVSCMVFVFLLESSQKASPMSAILDALNLLEGPRQFGRPPYEQIAIVTAGDMAIGGAMAGLAGSVASRNQPHVLGSVRLMPLWGLGVGMGLGLVAGIFQAGIEVGNLYLLEEQQKEEERQRSGNSQ